MVTDKHREVFRRISSNALTDNYRQHGHRHDEQYWILVNALSTNESEWRIYTAHTNKLDDDTLIVGIFLTLSAQYRYDHMFSFNAFADLNKEYIVETMVNSANKATKLRGKKLKLSKDEFLAYLSAIHYLLDPVANKTLMYRLKRFIQEYPFYYFIMEDFIGDGR